MFVTSAPRRAGVLHLRPGRFCFLNRPNRHRPHRAALLIACALALTGAPQRLPADDPAIRIVDVSLGFGGVIKVGRLTPVEVEIEGGGDEQVGASITAPDPDGSPVTWPLREAGPDEQGKGRFVGLFRVGLLGGVLRLQVGDATTTILFDPLREAAGDETPSVRLVRQSVPIVGVCAHSDLTADALRGVAGDETPQTTGNRIVVEFGSDASVPSLEEGLDALDVLVVTGGFQFDEAQSAAVSRWVRSGGHLVFGATAEVDELRRNALLSWMPLEFVEEGRFDDLASLVDRVRGRPELPSRRDAAGARLRFTEGQALVSSLDGAVVARVAYGLGRVTVCAVDWSEPPLAEWKGLSGLFDFLTDLPATDEQEHRDSAAAQLGSGGLSEMATQLASQLDQFPGVLRQRYLIVLVMILALVILVGPIDYWLVQRLLKRPRLTWVTLPVWVLAATLAADACADRWNGARAMANQFDLIDIDADSGLTRLQSRMTYYSDSTRRYELKAEVLPWLTESGDREQARVSWAGVPESGFRGMYRSGGLDLGNPPYSLGVELTSILNLPIDEHSSQPLGAGWTDFDREEVEGLVESQLVDTGAGRLDGTITHHLPGEITEWCLAYETSAYVFRPSLEADAAGGIPPGVAWDPEEAVQPRRLSLYLTGLTHLVRRREGRSGDDAIPGVSQYDPRAGDVRTFAQTLTFFEAAGGRNYTSLSNTSLQRSDLSRLLTLNRAVLFGRLETPGTEYIVDGQAVAPHRRTTYVRLILPVAPAGNSGSRGR